jgi:hypothetical protein
MTVQQQTQQQQQHQGDAWSRVLLVEKDVSSLKETMNSLAGTVDRGFIAISTELKARGTTNWTPIGMMIGAVLTVSGWGFGLFSSYQARTDAAIAEQKTVAKNFVARDDINDKFFVAREKNNDRAQAQDARVSRLERDVETASKEIVPRGEHAEKWSHQRSIDDHLQKQVDQLRGELNGLNSPRDTVQNILKRLEEVERERRLVAQGVR